MTTASSRSPSTLNAMASTGRGWQIFWDVLIIIAGLLAVLMPAIAALATALVLALVLIFAELVDAEADQDPSSGVTESNRLC